MAEIHVRRFVPADLPAMIAIDHSYLTDTVWQLDFTRAERIINVQFRQQKLPRPVRQPYPKDAHAIMDDWKTRDGILVAVPDSEKDSHQAVGYISLQVNRHAKVAHVTDLAVLEFHRRAGVATVLMLSAYDWAAHHQIDQIVLEMQSKNYPAIQLAKKLGFEFCGYSDRLYPNQEIALLFASQFG